MPTSHNRRIVIAFFVGLAISFISGHFYLRISDSVVTLALALKAEDVTEEIVYKDKIYTVSEGSVEPRPPSIWAENSILKLAYAKRVLRVAPPFAVPGADLDALALGVEALSDVERAFLLIDASLLERQLARHAFYPDGTLRAILDAETARRDFLLSGDGEDFDRYVDAARRVSREYIKESYLYEIAFRYFAPEGVQYATERHLIDKENSISTIHQLRDRMREQSAELDKLLSCVGGWFSACNTRLLAIPTINVFSTERLTPGATELARSFHDLVDESRPDLVSHQWPLVVLYDGYCQNPEVPPVVNVVEEDGVLQLREGADPRFLRPNDYLQVPFFLYFTKQGYSYIPSDPFAHYTCMVLPYDQGAAMATLLVRDFALTNNLGDRLEGSDLLNQVIRLESGYRSDTVYEVDAQAYVNAALAGIGSGAISPAYLDSLLDLALTLQYHTATAGDFTRDIAKSEARNIRDLVEGQDTSVPLNRSFFTRSAFVPLSMLLLPNIKPQEIYESFSLPKDETPYRYLSDITAGEMSLSELAEIIIRYHASN